MGGGRSHCGRIDTGIFANGRVRAAARLNPHDAFGRQCVVARQELRIFLGIDVVRYGGDVLGTRHQFAQALGERGPVWWDDGSPDLNSLLQLFPSGATPAQIAAATGILPQTSPLRRNADIQMAVNLDTIDKTDEAKQRLQKLLKEHPADIDAIMALGSILRGR